MNNVPQLESKIKTKINITPRAKRRHPLVTPRRAILFVIPQSGVTMINTHGMSELGYKILLDRYAYKDMERKTVQVGDVVIAIINGESKDTHQKRELGIITEINNDRATVLLYSGEESTELPLRLIDKPLETSPVEIQKRVARGVAEIEQINNQNEWTRKFEWLLDNWKFVPGGRILAAAGTDQKLSLFNCYVLPLPHDSRGGIIETLRNMTEIMSRGGGVGITLSSLRPKHNYVAGVNGRSSGSVSWGSLYSFVTGLIEQGGSRRGALLLALADWHPDVIDFINAKRQAGKITNANISVLISDKFMQAVENDSNWEFVFPHTTFENYDTEWDGQIDNWRGKGYPVIVHDTIKARKLWDMIIESAWSSAEPGVIFIDRVNQESNSWYYEKLIGTNPCLTGDTLIHTDSGLVSMKTLFDEEREFSVALDNRFGVEQSFSKSSRVFYTGRKDVYQITTQEGYRIKATADHRIMTSSGWVELQDLKPGDRIHILNSGGGFGTKGSLEEGRVLGWVVGDGAVSNTEKHPQTTLFFYGDEKEELAPVFAEYVDELVKDMPVKGHRKHYNVGVQKQYTHNRSIVESTRLTTKIESYGLKADKLSVPTVVFEGTEDMQRGYLQGLFSVDGSVQGSKEKGISVRLGSISVPLLEQVQILLLNFGIYSKTYKNRTEAGYKQMPDKKGGNSLYWCQAMHELVISRHSIRIFAERIGFLHQNKQNRLKTLLSERTRVDYRDKFVARVETIEYVGQKDVYDLTEPLTHSFSANGVIVHNCSEQPLPGWGICNLGAINLAQFYDKLNNDVDWEDLSLAVRYGVRFLDNVVDLNYYFLEENREQQLKERRVGLGTMGLAELLIRLGLRYGSPESIAFMDRLYGFIAENAYAASAQIAGEKGSFPAFEARKFLQSGFASRLPEYVRDEIKTYGIRNVTLLTVAPTGSTGTMVETSTGIEPYFSWKYYRRSRLGLHEENATIVNDYLEEYGLDQNATLPAHFVTAMELSPDEHVRVQAAAQKWIDSAISKTANVPREYTIEETSKLYRLMYDLGCKGGTIYRDGSRDEQVLYLRNPEGSESSIDPEVKNAESAHFDLNDESDVTIAHTQLDVYVDTVDATGHVELTRPVRPHILHGVTVKGETPYGTAFITINEDPRGVPFEIFITVGKSGSDLQAQGESLGRLISVSLQIQPEQNRASAFRAFIEQLRGIGGARSYGFGPNRVASFPDAIAKVVQDKYLSAKSAIEQASDHLRQVSLSQKQNGNVAKAQNAYNNLSAKETTAANSNSNSYTTAVDIATGFEKVVAVSHVSFPNANICPECQNNSLLNAEGCHKCDVCGYSEC
jgi:ribonucleoside-diphosphate reductase alpha chain